MQTRRINRRKRIALVSHDNKKAEIVKWVVANQHILSSHQLCATGTTGTLVENALNQPVKKFMSGPLGGDQQVGADLAEGNIDILIFFWDPMEAQPHDPDVKALLRLAVVWNIPVACDVATADFIFSSPLMNEEYECMLPDYTAYLKRNINKNAI